MFCNVNKHFNEQFHLNYEKIRQLCVFQSSICQKRILLELTGGHG